MRVDRCTLSGKLPHLLLVLVLLVSGCATTNLPDHRAEKKKGQGSIIVFRENSFFLSARSGDVASSNGHLCAVGNGGAVILHSEPGPVEVTVDLPETSGVSTISIQVNPNATSYLYVRANRSQVYAGMVGNLLGFLGSMAATAAFKDSDPERNGIFELQELKAEDLKPEQLELANKTDLCGLL